MLFMNVVNQVSIIVAVILAVVTVVYGRRKYRKVRLARDTIFVYLAIYLSLAWTSLWMSAIALRYELYWVYPLAMGIAIWVAIIVSYRLRQYGSDERK